MRQCRRVVGGGRGRIALAGPSWEQHPERRTMPHGADDLDLAAVLGHDPMHERESQPGPPLVALGGEEGLEDMIAHVVRNALARVGDGEPDQAFPVAPRAHRECASVGHRVRGVDGQVHPDLADLPAVRLDRQRLRRELELQRHVVAQQAPEKLGGVPDDLVQVQSLRFRLLVAGEQQQLLRELGTAAEQLLELLEPLLGAGQILAVQPGVLGQPEHGLQEVVEVVRDAARQPADRFHPLAPAQLLFHLLECGHVLLDRDEMADHGGAAAA